MPCICCIVYFIISFIVEQNPDIHNSNAIKNWLMNWGLFTVYNNCQIVRYKGEEL